MSIEIKIPEIGESISEATMGQWLKEDGESVEMDEIICEIESEKATMELTAEDSGTLQIFAKEGETVKIGSVIGKIENNSQSKANDKKQSKEESKTLPVKENEPESESSKKIKLSPVAKKILENAGINPMDVKTGSDNKITKEDALLALEALQSNTKKKSEEPQKADTPVQKQLEKSGDRSVTKERMTTLRKTIARRLLEAKNGTAMLTTINEIDMSAINEQRGKFKELFNEKHGIRLGFMSFFTKAVSMALHEFPIINASVEEDHIVYHNYHDIGIAVSTDRGLVVPVVRNVEKLSMAEIEIEIANLAKKAADNKLSIDEMMGGTFSITNGGVFGSLISTPLINIPQSAILGMHTIQQRPVVLNGEVVIRPMMYISLSYDHRIIDGKESVQFIVRLKQILEDPIRLLLDV